MKDLIAITIILLIILFLIAGLVLADEPNHYNEITEMLQLPPVPYPEPVNAAEREANLAYLAQEIREILDENRAVIDRIKRVIRNERIMVRGR